MFNTVRAAAAYSTCLFLLADGMRNLGLAGNPYIGHEAQKIQIPLDYWII